MIYPVPLVSIGPAQDLASEPIPQTARFQFHASGGEYFRIWIVNLLFTILTLGVYSAWAKARRLRYLYGNTTLGGSAFEYHGQPLSILKGRLIAAFLFGAYFLASQFAPLLTLLMLLALAAVFPWIVVRSRTFQMRKTSWRNVRFDFRGTYGEAAGNFLGFGLVAAVTLGLAAPAMQWARVDFAVRSTRFGDTPFQFEAPVRSFYRVTLLTALFGIGLFKLGTFPLTSGIESESTALGVLLVVVGVAALIAAPLLAAAYWESAYKNLVYGSIRIGVSRVNCRLEMRRLLWLYLTNIAGLLVTFGLFFPWALIRRLRYQLESISLDIEEDLDAFVAAAQSDIDAIGEELGEILDLEFGL